MDFPDNYVIVKTETNILYTACKKYSEIAKEVIVKESVLSSSFIVCIYFYL